MSAAKPKRRKCADCPRILSKARQGKKRCYPCEALHRKEMAERAHDRRVQERYGLLPGDYKALYDGQGGVCAICGRATGRTRRLSTDHDHKKGLGNRDAVRGLLCSQCNDMLGHGRDVPEFFEKAAEYLRHPPAQTILGGSNHGS